MDLGCLFPVSYWLNAYPASAPFIEAWGDSVFAVWSDYSEDYPGKSGAVMSTRVGVSWCEDSSSV